MEDKESFVFYETFFEMVMCLPVDKQDTFIRAIINYGIYGTEPQYEGAEKGMWLAIKNGIDECKGRRKSAKENGSKGGKSKKTSTAQAPLNLCLTPAKAEKNGLTYAKAEEEPLNLNGNVNVNVNGNVNVNDKVKPIDDDDSLKKINSDSVHDALCNLGYECARTSCGMIASIMNKQNVPIDFIKWTENEVSDKYPEVNAAMMVNALTTWTELYDKYRESDKVKKKSNKRPLSHCVKCGEEIKEINWFSNSEYFCAKCGFSHKLHKGVWTHEESA